MKVSALIQKALKRGLIVRIRTFLDAELREMRRVELRVEKLKSGKFKARNQMQHGDLAGVSLC